jgi:hypothetical protein
MTTLNCTQLNHNPDIAGIGIRASIYIQAFLSLVPATLVGAEGHISLYEQRTLSRIYANLLVTSCALLVSTFIQAPRLNVYHALIVLNLSWINNAGAIAWSFNYFASRSAAEGHGVVAYIKKHWRTPYSIRSSVFASIQLCGMAGLGIWVWAKLDTFGDQPECTPYTLASVFGKLIPVTKEPLRTTSFAFYLITAIPMINIFFFLILFLLPAFIAVVLAFLVETCWNTYCNADRALYLTGVLSGGLIDLLFIIDTELMIRGNAGRVAKGEGDWSFGQILAMLMVVLPLVEVCKECQEWYQKRPPKPENTAFESTGTNGIKEPGVAYAV